MDKDVRQLVWERCKGYCEKCGLPLEEDNWDFHHRQLRSGGGIDSPENGMAVHHACHVQAKGAIHVEVALSKENGYIVSKYSFPELHPILLYGKKWVYLDKNGKYLKRKALNKE